MKVLLTTPLSVNNIVNPIGVYEYDKHSDNLLNKLGYSISMELYSKNKHVFKDFLFTTQDGVEIFTEDPYFEIVGNDIEDMLFDTYEEYVESNSNPTNSYYHFVTAQDNLSLNNNKVKYGDLVVVTSDSKLLTLNNTIKNLISSTLGSAIDVDKHSIIPVGTVSRVTTDSVAVPYGLNNQSVLTVGIMDFNNNCSIVPIDCIESISEEHMHSLIKEQIELNYNIFNSDKT